MSQSRRHKFHGIPNSRSTLYKCLIPECDVSLRWDNLKRHYLQFVNNKSLLTGNTDELDIIQKNHTQYFINRGTKCFKDIPDKIHHTKILNNDATKISKYFTVSDTKEEQKRSIDDSDSDENNNLTLKKLITDKEFGIPHSNDLETKNENVEINMESESLFVSDLDSSKEIKIIETEPSTSKTFTPFEEEL